MTATTANSTRQNSFCTTIPVCEGSVSEGEIGAVEGENQGTGVKDDDWVGFVDGTGRVGLEEGTCVGLVDGAGVAVSVG